MEPPHSEAERESPSVELRVWLPREWKRFLDDTARSRCMSLSDVVRQIVRERMIRHRQEEEEE